ncbi:MAG: biopolymer transporter ExbD [Rhodobacteraceae bacterium]|nr:biopolymer transporter ExbD [Paracoccaceae bacterium]
MRLAAPRRRARGEGIVPMINVVFLLLVFLLLAAELEPVPPFEMLLPETAAAGGLPDGPAVLHIAADGTIAFGPLRGAAALAALPPGAPVEIRADAALPAATLAALLPRLAGAGPLTLVTVPR